MDLRDMYPDAYEALAAARKQRKGKLFVVPRLQTLLRELAAHPEQYVYLDGAIKAATRALVSLLAKDTRERQRTAFKDALYASEREVLTKSNSVYFDSQRAQQEKHMQQEETFEEMETRVENATKPMYDMGDVRDVLNAIGNMCNTMCNITHMPDATARTVFENVYGPLTDAFMRISHASPPEDIHKACTDIHNALLGSEMYSLVTLSPVEQGVRELESCVTVLSGWVADNHRVLYNQALIDKYFCHKGNVDTVYLRHCTINSEGIFAIAGVCITDTHAFRTITEEDVRNARDELLGLAYRARQTKSSSLTVLLDPDLPRKAKCVPTFKKGYKG